MRPVEFDEAVPSETRLTLFCADKPDRFFTVITFSIDKVSSVALDLKKGVPCYQVEDEEGRIHLPIEEENQNRWCLWPPDQAGFDSTSIFDAPKIAEAPEKRSEPVLDALQTSRSNGLANAKETDMTFE